MGLAWQRAVERTHGRGTALYHHEGGMPEAGYRERGRLAERIDGSVVKDTTVSYKITTVRFQRLP